MKDPILPAESGSFLPINSRTNKNKWFVLSTPYLETLLPKLKAIWEGYNAIGKRASWSKLGLIAFSSCLVAILQPAQAQTTATNLRVKQTISTQHPALGDVVTYTMIVTNAPGFATATGVRMLHTLPVGGVTYVPSSASILRGSGTYAPTLGEWSGLTITPGDSAVLTVRAVVQASGVFYNVLEVVASDLPDIQSKPANHVITENDYDATCFSVPIRLVQGDEFTLTIPSGYGQVTWYRNDQLVRSLPSSVATMNADSSLTIKSTGTYRFVTIRNGCQAMSCCDIEVIPGCDSTLTLTVSTNTSICPGETARLIATASVPTAQIRWYRSLTDVTPVATTSSGASLTVTPKTNTIYYAEAFTADGCVSARKPVTVTVTPILTPILSAGTVRNTCPATTVNLTTVVIENRSAGLLYEWYINATRSPGTLVTNLTAASAGTYYVVAKLNNCYSSPAVVTATVVDCNCQSVAEVTLSAGLTVCSGDVAPVKATLSGAATSLTWTSNGTGTFVNPTSLTTSYTPSASDIALGIVTLTATTNDPDGVGMCQPGKSSILLKINKRPDAPTNVTVENTTICRGNSTKLVGYTPGGTIHWYNSTNLLIGSTLSGAPFIVTPTSAGQELYYAEAVSSEGCTSSARSSVTVTVSNCVTDLAVQKQVVTPGPYQVGQKITYSITATNLGAITATNTRVVDVLPASLSYVNSTPAGQFSTATSIWTIGNLGAGMSRNLLIDATILATGLIKNTAIISSPENDPKRTNNDTSSVTIPVRPCIAQAPTIICAITEICKGGTTTLVAKGCENGTIIWSDRKTGATIQATPGTTTPYSASCVIGQCTSGSSNTITVTVLESLAPTITASADQVCPGTSVTLTAAGCAGGIIEWSDKLQTGASIVVIPTGKTTYTAQCRIGSCLSSPAVKTIETSAGLPIPTIAYSETAVCPGEKVTLTVQNCIGIPVWNSTTATTTSIIVTPTIMNNTYFVYCKNGACTSKSSAVGTIPLVAPMTPVVTASADSICSQGVVSLTATGCNGTIVWNVAGKTGSVITVNVTSATNYYARCSLRTCLSEASNTVRVNVLIPSTPLIATTKTLICSGEKVTLSATGCQGGVVNWYPINKMGAALDLYPTSSGEYYATCKQGQCESDPSTRIRITVNTGTSPAPVITASSTAVCGSGLVSLTATGCTGGTSQWSDGQVGAVVSVNVTPTNKEFYAICKLPNQCGSGKSNVISVNVTSVGSSAPTVVASTSSVCSGEKVTLTANGCQGTVHWYGVNQTGTSIDVYPTVTQTYYAICSQGTCSSPASNSVTVTVKTGVSPAPVLTASTTAVCGSGLVSLTATGCAGGTIQWSDGQVGAVISVSVTPTNREFYAICKIPSQCTPGKSNGIAIQVNSTTIPAPTVVTSASAICSGEKVTLSTTGCQGTVQWYGVSRIGASIDLYPTATQQYYAICTQAGCSSPTSNTVTVVVNTGPSPAPVIIASTTAVCGSGLVSLTATGCTGGTIQWSDGQSGPVVSVNVTPTTKTFYAICKMANQCGSGQSNSISMQVTPVVTPIVICSADSICSGESVKLTVQDCQGIPHWSTGETTASITITPTLTTSYTVYCQEGSCKSNLSSQYTIKAVPVVAPTITASATVVTPGSNVTLTASGCVGDLIWSANDINGNNKGPVLVVRPVGTQTYYAQCKYRQCLSNPSTVITVNPVGCVVNSGTLTPVRPTICADTAKIVILQARTNGGMVQPSGYSVVYLLAKEGVILKTSPTASFTVPATSAHYTIYTFVYDATASSSNYVDLSKVIPGVSLLTDVQELMKGRCVALDPVGAKIDVNQVDPPRLYGGPSLTVCQGENVTLGAIGCTGGLVTWSDGSIGETLKKTITSDLWLMATCTLNGCTSQSSSSIDIHLTNVPIPVIVSNHPALCVGETVSLTATGCERGTYTWSDGKTVGKVLMVSPSADVSYRVKCKVGNCEGDWSAYTTIKVGQPATPTITIAGGSSSTICAGAPVTLTAQGCGADNYVTWSTNQVGNSITVSPISSTTFTARCSTSNQCQSARSTTIAITVLSKVPQPVVRDITNTCPSLTVELAKALISSPATTGGLFDYYTETSLANSSKVADPSHAGAGIYYVVERTANGCVSLPVAIHVQITPCTGPTPCDAANPATTGAGPDASVCAGQVYRLNGVMGGSGKTAHWTSSGSGTFDNPYSVSATYTASAEDVMAGKVTLTLSVSTNNAACPVATDAMVLTVTGIKLKPVITVVGGLSLCYGDSVTLTASANATGYKWSNGATTQRIVVKQSGVYTVQLMDGTGCGSVKSDNVVVKVAEPVLPPLVRNLRNTCPAKIVDLTKALSMTTVGSTYTYRICECNTSNIVIRPDSVCEGTYWVVEKNANGCVSAPAKILVRVFNCAADTLNTDVRITKTVNHTLVNGAPVTYTLTVSNAGPHTAYHVDVRDVLPAGLQLVPVASPGYTFSNGVITKRIDSLKAGASAQLVFSARISKKGTEIVNKAEITYLDNNDPNLANNTSSVTVKDTASTPVSQTGTAGLGVALAVVKVVQLPDSSYNVTYKATLRNVGTADLTAVSLLDSLSKVFIAPASYHVVGYPVVGAGSTLVPNANFDGQAQSDLLTTNSALAVGVQDTTLFTVNVKTNGSQGPFYSNAIAVGYTADRAQVTMDISNNGFNPAPEGLVSTPVRFDLPKGLLGVAKSVGTPVAVQVGIYDVPYTITLSNMGSVPLKNVQVVDNLTQTFGHDALIVSNRISTASTGTVRPDTLYTGQGVLTRMLIDSMSTLAVGAKASLNFIVRVDVRNATTLHDSITFLNTAYATARMGDNQVVADTSTAGTNADPDNDLDPRNNSQATPVSLNSLAKTAYIGLAMSVQDTVRQADGSYQVTYQIVVKNYGAETLKNVMLTDSLANVFTSQAGATFALVGMPILTSTGSALKLNPNFNGGSDPVLVLGDSTSRLDVGKVDTIRVVVQVTSDGSTTTFLNAAYAQAQAQSGIVSDVSTSGLDPDLNGNGNPTDSNEREATPLYLPPTYLTIFIPQGFSPNGDGINDLFVIRGVSGLTVSLEVYNRWGSPVYQHENYKNDWDGKPNTGITLAGTDSLGVPDGTYYYVIKLSDGRKFVRYMTINR